MTMKTIRSLLVSGLMSMAAFASAHETGEPLNHEQRTFLRGYEKVRSALAADDLASAQAAAAALNIDENAAELVQTGSLEDARAAFKKLSKRAVHLAEGQAGYFIAHCPMVKGGGGNWVQTTAKVSNPYFGKSMATCGSIRPGKATAPAPKPDAHKHQH